MATHRPTKSGDNGLILTSGIAAGDTIIIEATQNPWSYLYFGNLTGTALNPITIVNEGAVEMTTNFKLDNCHYVVVSGSGTEGIEYGFHVTTAAPSGGEGFSIKGISTNIEMHHCKCTNKQYLIWLKNEVSEYPCTTSVHWPARYDTITLHHLYGKDLSQDGLYIGSSDPYGKSREAFCNGTTSSTSVAIPTTHPTTVTLTVGTGLSGYTVGATVQVKFNDTNYFRGTVSSYTSGTGALELSSTSHTGSGTYSSWTVETYSKPRPTGLKNIVVHDVYLEHIGRSGIQWGGTDDGTNKIYNCTILNCGDELNDQQGCGIAIGSASTNLEIYNNTISQTYKQSIFSYHYGNLYVHDNTMDSAGTIPAGTLAGMSNIFINTFDAENPSPTTFDIRSNTMGTYTGSKPIELGDSTSNYGADNYLCYNTTNGAALTSSHVQSPGGISWTVCSLLGRKGLLMAI